MTTQADGLEYVLLGAGIVLLLLAAFRPNYLRFVPGNSWFLGAYPAGRFGSIVAGITCIVVAAWRCKHVPPWEKGLVVVLLAFAIVAAAVYDMPDKPREDD